MVPAHAGSEHVPERVGAAGAGRLRRAGRRSVSCPVGGAKQAPPWSTLFTAGWRRQGRKSAPLFSRRPRCAVWQSGMCGNPSNCAAVADFAAFVVAHDGILGLFQGPAETGLGAVGHRSILANPCNPHTLENINRRVKFREPIRPLAPMATLRAARQLFELPPGTSSANFNAFNFMVLTALAHPIAYVKVPAVVHHDGTSAHADRAART